MPGPSPLNSACRCCSEPPSASVELQYVSVEQSCNTTSCGELPCTSSRDLGSIPQHDYTSTTNYEDTNNVQTVTYRDGGEGGTVVARQQYANATGAVGTLYDADGNCITTEQVCSPNWADLTRSEKCAAKRYLTITEVDRSGGGNHGRTLVRQYTTDADANCDVETTCSGGYTVTTRKNGSESYTYTCDEGDSKGSASGSMNSTEVETFVYNEDCTKDSTITCSGTSHFSSSVTSCYEDPQTDVFSCSASFSKGINGCEWNATLTANGADDGTNAQPCVPAETTTVTVVPAITCNVTVTYTGENEQGSCTPKQFPAFPAFTECTPEGEEPPEPPELQPGQGNEDEAYKYENPNNPQIKSERKVQYRVEHGPTGTCYLKVWFRKKIQQWKYEDCDSGFPGDPPRTQPWSVDCSPNGQPCTSRWSTDGEPTFQDDGNYEWKGSGYPCYAEDDKVPEACENKIYGTPVKNLTAGQNQSVTLEYKYSFVEDYEPNWPDDDGSRGCKPNAFPIADPEDCPEYNP